MPMSPVATMPQPSAASSSAIAAPARSPATACSRAIAGPAVASAVPAPSRTRRTAGWSTGSQHAGVDDHEAEPGLAGQNVDRGAAGRERGEHLAGHLLG